jgi:HK97 family phage portal protein
LGFFSKKEKRSISNYAYQTVISLFSKTKAGTNVSEETALALSAVYGCVNVISGTIASLPINVIKTETDGSKNKYQHPVHTLLHNEPNEYLTAFTFWQTILAHRLLWGNGYALIQRNASGVPQSLQIIHPEDIKAVTDGFKVVYEIKEDKKVYKSADILHLKCIGVDGVTGMSPISLHRETIGRDLAANDHASAFFKNGANPNALISVEGNLTKEKAAEIRKDWNEVYGGENKGSVAVLGANVKYNAVEVPFIDTNYIEVAKLGKQDIATIYNMPLHKLQILEGATNNNIEEQARGFVQDTIRPICKEIEQECDKKLFRPKEKQFLAVKFNFDALLRGNSRDRAEYYRTMVNIGAMSINEVRRLENINNIDGGDSHFMQMNMTTIDQITEGSNLKKEPETVVEDTKTQEDGEGK